MKSRYLLYISITFFFSSCYQEEDITGEQGIPKYKVEDSSDPTDHFIYGFYQKYNSFILYKYENVDYMWNMSSILPVNLVRQTERTCLNEGVQFMERAFFKYYADQFKKDYFPFKILMADSVQVVKSGTLYPNEPATAGISFMSIGNIREGISGISKDSLIYLRGEINAVYWANALYDNDRITLPEAFWNISEDYYGINLKNLDENENIAAPDIDVKKYGFWEQSPESVNPKYYCMAPKQTLDLYQFIKMMTTHTQAEMEALIAPYSKLKDKYYLLVNRLKNVYGVDIQAIGNDN